MLDLQRGRAPLDISEGWDGFAVCYFARSIKAFVYLHFWRLEEGTGVGLEIDDQVPYVEPGGMAEGEWLERFLCAYVAACGSSGCINESSRPYSLGPFDMTTVIAAWREHGAPREPARGFFMFSKDLVSADEAHSWAMNRSVGDQEWLRYFQVPGYHVFSTLSRRCWWEM
ncbi:hypothetical protein [Myxococcus sp. Y35]|uniref:hypothetical protein n=1 Tax=Pseudomyxococcus flavus TaxID=3115648 RepID=UPI003CF9342D